MKQKKIKQRQMKQIYWNWKKENPTKPDKIVNEFTLELEKCKTIQEVLDKEREYTIKLHQLCATGYSEFEEELKHIENQFKQNG